MVGGWQDTACADRGRTTRTGYKSVAQKGKNYKFSPLRPGLFTVPILVFVHRCLGFRAISRAQLAPTAEKHSHILFLHWRLYSLRCSRFSALYLRRFSRCSSLSSASFRSWRNLSHVSTGIGIVFFTRLYGMKAQCFSFGMKFRPIGKDQTSKIDLTFRPNCGIINSIKLADIFSTVA